MRVETETHTLFISFSKLFNYYVNIYDYYLYRTNSNILDTSDSLPLELVHIITALRRSRVWCVDVLYDSYRIKMLWYIFSCQVNIYYLTVKNIYSEPQSNNVHKCSIWNMSLVVISPWFTMAYGISGHSAMLWHRARAGRLIMAMASSYGHLIKLLPYYTQNFFSKKIHAKTNSKNYNINRVHD